MSTSDFSNSTNMEWVLANPEIHSIFESLGHQMGDFFQINGDCCENLELILNNILTEDKALRSYRRNISFGQNIRKDLIPLLIHATEDKIIDLIIRILLNLTIPVESLLSLKNVSQTDIGRHVIFELNNLIRSSKEAFADSRTTKVFVDYLKRILGHENAKLSAEKCLSISNCLLFLRNVLHMSDDNFCVGGNPALHCAAQNKFVWNLFGQSINKILIQLMTSPQAANWSVTMVQIIALLYKDQHVGNLQKLLNGWLETTLSESSEDNESNTSPPNRRSEDSSPMLTSDPTSDSSDGGNFKNSDNCDDQNVTEVTTQEFHKESQDLLTIATKMCPPFPKASNASSENMETNKQKLTSQNVERSAMKGIAASESNESMPLEPNKFAEKPTPWYPINRLIGKRRLSTSLTFLAHGETFSSGSDPNGTSLKRECKSTISDLSDCGYVTQIENQESISTSSNEDDLPQKKPVHQKPHNPKQRVTIKVRNNATPQDKKEKRKKKLVRRIRPYIISLKGLVHYAPNDEDITNVLKEFTVDFMLKGYGPLVQILHQQLVLEIEMHQISKVLCFDIISFLTSEGVNLCEQLEIAIKTTDADVKPFIRRTHLVTIDSIRIQVVTSIREFVQTMEMYKKGSYLTSEDREQLVELQVQICQSDELRCLLLLLLRHYRPKYHNKQYLKDLIVTNHTLLLFLDNVMKMPEYHGSTNMLDHVKQFATDDVMYQYGYMLEDYANNGEFLNDCVFTIMHHVAGDLDNIQALYQPIILKSFSAIRKSEFELCDDWCDLIEYVINSFIKNPHLLKKPFSADVSAPPGLGRKRAHALDADLADTASTTTSANASATCTDDNTSTYVRPSTPHENCENFHEDDMWDGGDEASLKSRYIECKELSNTIDEIVKRYTDDGVFKSRITVIRQLHKQDIIDERLYISYMKKEGVDISSNFNDGTISNSQYCHGDIPSHNENERTRYFLKSKEIKIMCREMINDKKIESLQWLQRVLLECCFIKISLLKTGKMEYVEEMERENGERKKKVKDIMAPVTYHKILSRLSIPLVPWSCWQAAACRDMRFLQLLHRLGLHLPIDSGELFIRIPNFWSVDLLFEVAANILPIDISTLKFSINDISPASAISVMRAAPMMSESWESDRDGHNNPYRVHRLKQVTDIVQFTPFAALVETTHVMTAMSNTPEIVMGPPLPVGPAHPLLMGPPRHMGPPPALVRPTPLHMMRPPKRAHSMTPRNRMVQPHATMPLSMIMPPPVGLTPRIWYPPSSTRPSNKITSTQIKFPQSSDAASLISPSTRATSSIESSYSMSSLPSVSPHMTMRSSSSMVTPNPIFLTHTMASPNIMPPQHAMCVPEVMDVSPSMIPIRGVGLSHTMTSLHPMGVVHVSHTQIQHSFMEPASDDESVSDTDSVASDLTRMYVSDEDETDSIHL